MPILTLEVGDLSACCYIVFADAPGVDGAPCVVIDPGAEAERISSEVEKAGLRVETILLTHSHVDHIGGVEGLLREWPKAVVACSAETSRRIADPALNLSVYIGQSVECRPAGRILAHGERFSAAGMQWRSVEIPGHDPGEMVYILGDGGEVFAGDTVFAGSIGRSDFPGGDGEALVEGVLRLLESLPAKAVIRPGHGPATLAKEELAHNPFLA